MNESRWNKTSSVGRVMLLFPIAFLFLFSLFFFFFFFFSLFFVFFFSFFFFFFFFSFLFLSLAQQEDLPSLGRQSGTNCPGSWADTFCRAGSAGNWNPSRSLL